MKTTVSPVRRRLRGFARIFDIVNGFLIDAVAHASDLSRDRAVNMRHKIWLRLIVRTYYSTGVMQACR
jgi:hypothetical protein